MANSAGNGNDCQGVMVFDLSVPQKVFIWTCEFLKAHAYTARAHVNVHVALGSGISIMIRPVVARWCTAPLCLLNTVALRNRTDMRVYAVAWACQSMCHSNACALLPAPASGAFQCDDPSGRWWGTSIVVS